MANANVPSGLSPVAYLNGSAWNGQARTYYIPSTDGNAYAIGDPVATVTGAADAMGISAVVLATAGTANALRGVIVGTMGSIYGGPGIDPASPQTTVIPASKLHGYYVKVVDDPNVIFEIQATAAVLTAVTSVATVGKNAVLKSGVNNGYVSGWTMDDGTTTAPATTIGFQLKILGLVQRPDNVPGAYAKYHVLINNHEFKATVIGV